MDDFKIYPEMTVLDIICRHRETESVFKKYNEQAGTCICCNALFDTLEDVAKKYNLDLGVLLSDLKAVANSASTGNTQDERRDVGSKHHRKNSKSGP